MAKRNGPGITVKWDSAAQHKRVKEAAAALGQSMNEYIIRRCDPAHPLRNRPVKQVSAAAASPELRA